MWRWAASASSWAASDSAAAAVVAAAAAAAAAAVAAEAEAAPGPRRSTTRPRQRTAAPFLLLLLPPPVASGPLRSMCQRRRVRRPHPRLLPLAGSQTGLGERGSSSGGCARWLSPREGAPPCNYVAGVRVREHTGSAWGTAALGNVSAATERFVVCIYTRHTARG